MVNQRRISKLAIHSCHAPDHLLRKVVGGFRDVVSYIGSQIVSQAYHSGCSSISFLLIHIQNK
jgi:hypothetical protein